MYPELPKPRFWRHKAALWKTLSFGTTSHISGNLDNLLRLDHVFRCNLRQHLHCSARTKSTILQKIIGWYKTLEKVSLWDTNFESFSNDVRFLTSKIKNQGCSVAKANVWFWHRSMEKATRIGLLQPIKHPNRNY